MMIVDADIVEGKEDISGYAIASLVLSLFGVLTCGVTAILGIIFGVIALRKKSGPLSVADKIFSIIGILVGSFTIFFMLIMLTLVCVSYNSVRDVEYRSSQTLSCSTSCGECYSKFMSFHHILRDSVMETAEKVYPASASEVFDQVPDSYMGGILISCSDSCCAGYVYYYLPEVYSFAVDIEGREPILLAHAPGEDVYQAAYADGESMTFFQIKSLRDAFNVALKNNRYLMRLPVREQIEQALSRLEKDVLR